MLHITPQGKRDKVVLRQQKHRILLVLAGSFFNIFKLLTYTILVLYVFAVPTSAQKILERLSASDPTQPWQIEADEINYDDKALQYIVEGNVLVSKGDTRLTADYVRFNRQAMKAYAQGNVKLTAGNDVLTGSSMDIDLKTQTGTIFDGYIFLQDNNFHITGGRIEKLSENSYEVEDATVTTCDGDNPAWLITGKHLKVTIEGYGVIKHAALKAKNTPVFYTPYLVFPAKLKRQTGLLLPELGASERLGFFWIQPFFWAINESSDATFYGEYLSERGPKFGLEYRYMLSQVSKGTLMFDYLDDRKVDDGTGDTSDKYGFGDDTVLRPNDDRYWFRMSHYQGLPLDFYAKVNLDVVSDQDYLVEFRYGLTGFYETEKYFNKNFNRVFEDYANPVRTNMLNLNRNWDQYSLNLEMLWFDNVIERRFSDTDTTLKKLPFISFDGSKQRILASPFFFDLESEYAYFYRQDGDKSHRADIQARLYLPYELKNYLIVEPSFGLRGTVWSVSPEIETTGDDDRFNRQIYDVKLDLTSQISKVFDVNSATIDRIKHYILTEISYDYIPDQDQSDLPQFDPLDRIDEQNLLTYSFTNVFNWRLFTRQRGTDDSAIFDYRQVGRLKLGQSYDINEARDDMADGIPDNQRRPFSPIKADLDLFLGRYLTVDADAGWDVYDDKLTTANAGVIVTDKRGDRFYTDYRFSEDESESIYFNINLRVSERFATFFEYERNILDDQRIDTIVGIAYESQCWAVEMRYIDEPQNRTFQFSINLLGLGEFGF